MPNEAKVKEVADLTELFKDAPSVAVTDYAGLTVEKITQLRKELRDADIKYLVAKNTLLRLAAKDAGIESLAEFFIGPSAVAFGSDDAGRLAKILYDFGKANTKPEIRALLVEGQVYSGDDTVRIAKLPSREDLLSMLVGNITAPLQNFVGTLDGVMREFILTLDALKENKEN